MFEQVIAKLQGHAGNLEQYLDEIKDSLTNIVENTRSEVEYDEFSHHADRATADAEGTAVVSLQANEGYSWHTKQVGLTGSEEGNCAVYITSVAPDNLIDVFRGTGITAKDGKYFVPRGSAILFHFYEQTPGQVCTAAIQVQQLKPKRERNADTGTSNEHYDHPRVEPVPSGTPLDTVIAPR